MPVLFKVTLLGCVAVIGGALAIAYVLHSGNSPPRRETAETADLTSSAQIVGGHDEPGALPTERDPTIQDDSRYNQPPSELSSVLPAAPLPIAATVEPQFAQQINQLESALREFQQTNSLQQRALESTLRTLEAAQPPAGAPTSQVGDEAQQPPPDQAAVAGDQKKTDGGELSISGEGDDHLTINVHDADIREVLELFSQQGDLNIVAGKNVQGNVSAALSNVSLRTALDAILQSGGFLRRREGDVLFVGTKDDFGQMDHARDRILTRIYRPNYVTAAELLKLINPMLTGNVGAASVAVSSEAPALGSRTSNSTEAQTGIPSDSTTTGGDEFAGAEVLMVRDYLSVLAEIDRVVLEVDRKPRQVVIEAMVISVRLDDELNLGVNFELLRDRNNVRLITGTPVDPLTAINLTADGLKFGFLDASSAAFVDALESMGDTNVIASPRLVCLNKQRAEIHIGSQLGYVSTTVTENAATQSIEFLEVGTQLRFRPFIADDQSIRLEVHPELSTGNVRIEQGFTVPDKDVTQVTTNVICQNGSTLIIGGLMREDLSTTTQQLPLLGSLPLLGPVFRQKSEEMQKHEIIVLITPRIIGEPEAGLEGQQFASEYIERQETYADKMSPLGRRSVGRDYLRKATAAWNADDPYAALRYANLAIHYDPQNVDAIRLRNEVVNVSDVGSPSIGRHLHEGLNPLNHPRRDYSRRGFSWQRPSRFEPDRRTNPIYDSGQPGRAATITITDEPE
ncbi:MAG: hypothetical protein QGG36_13285 [Pirellulaceae bacterium]|jgi:type IV pilus assembly protein PilQ|nr:hypothetical protein [Pirellulaceae bacterium]MDP7016769.1 hypothetical protein [Pirellulaceae bacterium]